MAKQIKKQNNNQKALWHSAEHVLTQAMLKLYPGLKMAMGPATDEGFYFDFEYDRKINKEDFLKIEKEVQKIIDKDLPFKREELTVSEARKLFPDNPYKQEWLDEIKKRKEKAVIYRTGDEFVDLCAGPHIKSTGEIGAFKLLSVAGAYWHGEEKNKMLTRIYGVAFRTKKELDNHLFILEEAVKRDHRKLGEKLELFLLHDSAPGMPYWLPKGVILYNELIKFWREEHQKRGYQEIITPILNKKELYETSGHWEHYREEMFLSKTPEDEIYGVKAMNCPNAIIVYQLKPRSYRDLPLRFSDIDPIHRYERSGTLYGLLRVRAFRQDDAHIFISEDQIKSEYENILDIVKKFYSTFNLEYSLRLGTRPEKFMGDIKSWNKAEKILKYILKTSGKKYFVLEGDGAFYGPKIDILMKDSLGREWQMGTIQLDFQMPKRFELTFTDAKGRKKTPVIIHRVIYGALERFIGILLENYAGNLPLWLSPEQIWVIPVGSKHEKYAQKVSEELKNKELRIMVKNENETVSKKIREGEIQKIPYLLVVGDEETKSKSVRVRERGKGDMGIIKLTKFLDKIKIEIKNKK